MSPWHIVVAEGMMCNRLWVIAIVGGLKKALGKSEKLLFNSVFKTTVNIYNLHENSSSTVTC